MPKLRRDLEPLPSGPNPGLTQFEVVQGAAVLRNT